MSELTLERLPESEIYGRSLSTIYKLGALMVNTEIADTITSPEADQARVEFYTSVEEGFGTDMELGGGLEVRDFDERPVIHGRVMAKDLKTAISDMTHAGLVCAEATVEVDERFRPQLVRSKWDHQNALAVDDMAKGRTDHNTRIVISPFPEEGAVESGDDYWRSIGYVPHLKRGFVQLYHANGDKVLTGSLSFDGSNKQQLKKIFEQYGVEIPEGEITDNWLKYAITATLSENDAKDLAMSIADQAGDPKYKKTTNTVDVTHEYRSLMDQVFDESYIHISESLFRGRQTDGVSRLIHRLANNAQHFNGRYSKALYKMRANRSEFTDDDSVVLHELLVYSTIEMMRALSLNKKALDEGMVQNSGTRLDLASLQHVNSSDFQSMLSGFGADGARNNRVYSACGLSIALGDGVDGMGGPQSAFGGADEDKENWKWKPGVCRVKTCGKKTLVGPCSVCQCCQDKFDIGKDPTVEGKYENEKQETLHRKETLSALGWSGMDDELHRMIDQESKHEKEKSSSEGELVAV